MKLVKLVDHEDDCICPECIKPAIEEIRLLGLSRNEDYQKLKRHEYHLEGLLKETRVKIKVIEEDSHT